MKKIFALILVTAFAGINLLSAQKLEKVWETSDGLKTPESVIYSTEKEVIYVANINGESAAKDGNGYISVLKPDGSLKNAEWVTGLNAPKGMAIFKGKLYVSDIDQLVEIDIETGKVLKKYDAPGAVFLNDVTACMNGMIFVSDTRTAKIHVLNDGKLTVWMEGEPLKSPNGLMAEGGKLLVGDENIYEVDIQTKKVTLLVENAGGVDGLERNNNGELVFSNWPGRIFIHRNGKTVKLLDTTAQELKTADVDFALKLNLLFVPTFFGNQIVAYKIVD
ncbi:MAG TPA: ATP-binding protein [Prolixibacteraceae bacterium]|nr:ATP-binding protein [Prolixibacteraceae bacterium]